MVSHQSLKAEGLQVSAVYGVTAKHRAQLKLPLSSRLKGPSVPLMQKHLGFPNETWDSLGSHVILLAIYWISWDFLGIYWILWDIIGI